jgi:molecular chaperone DnaJ
MSATANVTKVDFYEVLEVSRDSSDQELKTSYRRLAMQYHPDRNPNNPEAEEKFKTCSEAYQVLSDPEKRAAYDRYGHAAFQGGAPAGGSPFGGAQDLGDIFGDLFGEMFNMGGTRRASRVQRGRDLRYDLTLEFEQAVFGTEKEISIRRQEACDTSAGIFLGGQDLRALRGDGDDDLRSVCGLPWRGLAGEEARDPGEGAGGRGAGHTDSLPGRG